MRSVVALVAALAGGCFFDSSGTPAADRSVALVETAQADAGDEVTDAPGSVESPPPDAVPEDSSSPDRPSPDLRSADLPWCGDGILEAGEQCDDGNKVGGDGCSAVCQVEPFHSDLVAYWTMDESGGGTAADSAGSHDGNLKNMSAASWVTGKMKNALEFDGNNDYVTVGQIGAYDDLTMALWIRASSLSRSYNAIFHCNGWSPGDVHLMILKDGRVRFSLKGNSSTDRDSSYSFSNQLNKWHHLAVVYRRGAKTVDFYVDGAHDVTRSYTQTRSAVLGALRIGGWDGGSRYFSGRIDDLRFYKVAVGASHIKYLAGL